MTDKEFLIATDCFFYEEDDLNWDYPGQIAVNLNDTFGWACADCELLADEDISEVARLFKAYGWCGLVYWASEKRDGQMSEFKDINRRIEFVRQEEALIKVEPSSSKRAYMEWPVKGGEGET